MVDKDLRDNTTERLMLPEECADGTRESSSDKFCHMH